MFLIVPLPGDEVLSNDGVLYTVLGYINTEKIPIVLAQSLSSKNLMIPFNDIQRLNGQPVKMGAGKVLYANVRTKHKFQLPQNDDHIFVGAEEIKVSSLKINQRGKLSNGLIVIGNDIKSNEKITVRLADVTSIYYANGNKLLNMTLFKKQFHDYLGAVEKS